MLLYNSDQPQQAGIIEKKKANIKRDEVGT